MYEILGLPLGDGHPPKGFGMALYSPDSRARLEAATAEAMPYDGGRIDLDLSIRHAAGYYIDVRVTGAVRHIGNSPAFLEGTMAELEKYRYAAGDRG